MTDKVAEHVNREAEMALLGSVIVEPDVLLNIDFPDVQDFHFRAHQHVAQVLHDLDAEGAGIESIVVADRLEQRGVLDEVGGRSYISDLVSSVTTTTSAGYHADIVRRNAQLSRLDGVSVELKGLLNQPEADPSEVASEATALIERAVEGGTADEDLDTEQVLDGVIQEYHELGQGKLPGIPTGIPSFDRALGGIPKHNVHLLVGRTSEGKTLVAKSIALKMALRGIHVGYETVEMTAEQICGRMLQEMAKVSRYDIRHQDDDVKRRIGSARDKFPSANIFWREPSYDVQDVIRHMQQLHVRKGCEVIFIDLFNKITTQQHADSKPAMHSYVFRTLQDARDRISRRTGRPLALIVICQINRQATQSKSGRPALHHLKETGALEEDACLVLGVYRPERWGESEDESDLRLLLLKAQSESLAASGDEFPLYLDEPRQVVEERMTDQAESEVPF